MKTVLIAEDERSNYMLLNVLLRKKYNIIKAEDGVEAVKMAQEHKPDLIFMDIKMPQQSGFAAIDQIRKTMPNVPIIVESAYTFDADISLAIHHGANAYLTKPIQQHELDEVLAKFG